MRNSQIILLEFDFHATAILKVNPSEYCECAIKFFLASRNRFCSCKRFMLLWYLLNLRQIGLSIAHELLVYYRTITFVFVCHHLVKKRQYVFLVFVLVTTFLKMWNFQTLVCLDKTGSQVQRGVGFEQVLRFCFC